MLALVLLPSEFVQTSQRVCVLLDVTRTCSGNGNVAAGGDVKDVELAVPSTQPKTPGFVGDHLAL